MKSLVDALQQGVQHCLFCLGKSGRDLFGQSLVMAVMFLLGSRMDFRTDKLSSGFVFENPNQTSACGCGESVQLTPAKTADDLVPTI